MTRTNISKFLLIVGAIILIILTPAKKVFADCSFEALPSGGFSIVCTDDVVDEITGTNQRDTILILPDAHLVFKKDKAGNSSSLSILSGIDSLEGDDEVINRGKIEVLLAYAETTALGANLTIDENLGDEIDGSVISDTSADAETVVRGVDSGPGVDVVDNQSEISANAEAMVKAADVAVNINITADGTVTGSSLNNASVAASAETIGLDGGDDNDYIMNSGGLEIRSDTDVEAVSVGLSVSGSIEGNVDGGALSDSSATANSKGTGIYGGLGVDEITNRGAIAAAVESSSTSVGVAVDIGITKEGNASGAALSDASVTANAAASGIDGGGDSDNIDNRGNIGLGAYSDATGVAVSLTVAGTMKGEADGKAVSDASVTATSTATGIDGGEGNDTIDNEGMIALGTWYDETEASATAVSVTLAVSGAMEGNVAGEALSDSSALADAKAVGIDGGEGLDTINNRGAIAGFVDADATAVGVGVDIGITGEGNVSGAALSDASVTANAAAIGIDGGREKDTIDNSGDGDIDLYSTSEATGVAVSLTLAGTMKGDADGTALSDSSTTANASGTGIDGGSGMDEITNSAHVTADVDSTVTGVSVSVPITITEEGSVVGSAVSDASVTASALAMGIDGGDGDDKIVNAGAVTLMKGNDTDASATGVAVGLSISGKISLGKEEETPDAEESEDGNDTISGILVSDASATANAEATGIDGGGGVDDITNTSEIVADVGADATSVSVSLGIAGSVTTNSTAVVDITGEALSDASATANASATGISGDMGGDTVDNLGAIDLSSGSEATGVAVGVNISGKVGLNKGDDDEEAPESENSETDDKSTVSGKALSDASATANAEATGIDGGAGVDDITNSSTIVVNAISDADAVGVSLGVAVDVTTNSDSDVDIMGEALNDARATANAAATGIAGGDDDDTIVNTGTIMLMERNDTDASAMGVAVSLNVSGKVSLNKNKEDGETPEAVTSEDDEADDKDKISGKAVSISGAMSNAEAMGIDGSGGVDEITNTADIFADVGADATAVSVALDVAGSVTTNSDAEVDITGAALSDASATANATATGIDGGKDGDTIGNQGYIDLSSDSGATGVAASLSVAGAVTSKGDTEAEVEGSAISDTSVMANATATGIDGGEAADTIRNKTVDGVENAGTIRLGATSGATGVSASLGVTTAVTINGDTKADVAGSTVSDASVTAKTLTMGIAGGEGGDGIDNEGYIDLYSDSSATGVAAGLGFTSVVTVKGNTDAEVTGETVSDTTVDSSATTIGIDGGGGVDTIDNSGDIDLLATSDALGVAAALDVTGSLTFKGVAKSDVSGAAVSKSSVKATAAATGIEGGDGDDGITNTGAITIMDGDDPDAVATAVAASLSVAANAAIKGISTGSVSGTALSESLSLGNATATGIDGGAGNDIIDNKGALNLLPNSDATSVAASLGITVGMSGEAEGSALSDSSVTAKAAATGIDGGDGVDTIINEGVITLMKQEVGEDEEDAAALGVAVSLSISGNAIGTSEGQALSEASVTADTATTGIDGGGDADTIINTGKISADVDSHAEGVSVAADITVANNGTAAGSALGEASVAADASAIGIDGGDGDDTLVNETVENVDGSGEIELFATSDATATAVSVSIAGAMNGAAEGGALSKAGVVSDAVAIGIDGGAGADTITNRSKISGDVSSTSDATSVAVGITISVHGKADGEALSDTSVTALGTAIGIDGGDSGDRIENEGLIDMEAISSASATTVSVQLAGSMGGVAKGKAMADGSSEAISHAAGIDGGDGEDEIDSSMNNIITHAESTADSESVSVSLAGSVGLASGSSVADASATGMAYATGIDGGQGIDSIENSSEIESTAKADAEATSTSVGVTIGVGSAETIGTGDSSATARANATGIEGGEEEDEIINTAVITVGGEETLGPMANAQAGATTVTVGLAAGLNTAEASSNAAAIAEVNAFGISGGSGDDVIDNTGDIVVKPDSQGKGIMANARAESTTVDISLTVGASLGEASSDTSSTAVVNLAGISGGSGNDTVDNSGNIIAGRDFSDSVKPEAMATATAGSETFSVGLTVGGSFKDASSNASATAQSKATGIETGLGDDSVNNTGDINTFSSSAALGSAKAEKVSMTIGALEGAVKSEALSLSTALATGIDSGEDADIIDNDSDFVVKAYSVSTTTSNAEDLNILSIGSALQSATANSSSTAEALARGIDGGTGGDTITAAGTYSIIAETMVSSTSRSSTVTGLGLGVNIQEAQSSAGTVSKALAMGIDGGEGDDDIKSTATLWVNTFSRADTKATSSTNTGFNIAGASSGESAAGAATDVTASGIGIRGGISALAIDESDADTIMNEGPIFVNTTVMATTESTSTSDSIALFGAADGKAASDASARVTAEATGIDSGADNDIITSKGELNIKSTASGKVTSTSNVDSEAVFGDATSRGASDASANLETKALGINGGADDDIISSEGPANINVNSTVSVAATSNVNADVTFGGASSGSVSDASVSQLVEAQGIAGGTGDDVIKNLDTFNVIATAGDKLIPNNVTSTSNSNADSTFGNASTGSVSNASIKQRLSSRGIDGGAGNDEVTNSGILVVTSGSYSTVASVANANADTTFGDASSGSVSAAASVGSASSKGIIGGGEDDRITNLGQLSSKAEVFHEVTSSSVSIADTTFGDAFAAAVAVSAASGEASSLGVSGDDGNDFVDNQGILNARAMTDTKVATIAVAIADSTFGDEETVAAIVNFAAGDTSAVAINTGDGDDEILNSELITAEAGVTVEVANLSVSSDGDASSDSRTRALARANGIDTSNGDDTIVNNGHMLVTATPRVLSANRTFGSGGNVAGLVGIDLAASAEGISSGRGNDTITNNGDLLVLVGRQGTSNVTASSTSGSDKFMDAARGKELIGKWIRFEVEEMPDFFTVIESYDEINAEFTLRDPLNSDLQSGGIYTIFDVEEDVPDIGLSSVTVGGRLFVDASTTAAIRATGIEASDGEDHILNSAAVRVKARNNIQAGELKLGAVIKANLRTASKVESIGIAGDDQSHVTKPSEDNSAQLIDESLLGEAQEAIVGKKVLIKTGNSAGFLTVAEGFDPDTGTITLADPIPISGFNIGDTYVLGGGSDQIINQAEIDVGAEALLNVNGLTLSFLSDINKEGVAQTIAEGIQGGEFFDNEIFNSGFITAKSRSEVVGTERAKSFFAGISGQELSFTARSESEGVSSGSGNDLIINGANVEVEAVSTAMVQGVTSSYFSFDIGTRNENLVDAHAEAKASGLELGDGDNIAENNGIVSVFSKASPPDDKINLALAISDASYGETSASATATTDALSRGIHGQKGTDTVLNNGEIIVLAESIANSYARASDIIPAQDQSTVTALSASANNKFTDESVKGLDASALIGKSLRFPEKSNLDFLDSESTITALTSANSFTDDTLVNTLPDDVLGKRLRFPTVDNSAFVTIVTGFQLVTANNITTAELTLADNVPTDSNDDPLVIPGDDYTLSILSTEVLTFDSETGVFTLGNDLPSGVMVNDKYTLSLVSDVNGGATTFTDDTRKGPIAEGTIVTFPRFPTFDARVVDFDPNSGLFELSKPIPLGLSAEDIYALSIDVSDGRSGSTGTAFATGIDLGDEDAVVDNMDVITVQASAISRTEVVAKRGTENAIAKAAAEARGIRTGDGNDEIRNTGEIFVSAVVVSDSSTGFSEERALATGIETGSGNDFIHNGGVIDTSVTHNNSAPVVGIGIDSGDGNDTVVLGDGSLVNGAIDLGADDDTLHLIGSPLVNGEVLPDGAKTLVNRIDALVFDGGNDALIFEGSGHFANSLQGFEMATKQGSGTYSVPRLPTMKSLEIKEGTLKTEDNYTFADSGIFQTTINSDGSHGKLHVVGLTTSDLNHGKLNVVSSTTLDGNMIVLRDTAGPFINDTRYDIIEAENGVNGSFKEVTLPASTQLLNFTLEKTPTLVEVEAHAKSFTTVATNRVERALAKAMDRWLPTATGDLRTALGEFQALSLSEFGKAFQGFSPGQYDRFTLAAFDTTRQFNQTLLQRVHSVRLLGETTISRGREAYFASGDRPLLLVFNGPAESIGQLYRPSEEEKPEYGMWLESFGQWGDQDEDNGFVGYDYHAYGAAIGLDKLFRDRFLFGIGFGYSSSDIDMDQTQGDGDIDTVYGSLYGSYFNEKGYLDGTLTYGRQDYDSRRRIEIGPIQQTAKSNHDGVSFSAMFEGGLNFDRKPWVLQPFANLQYIYLDEDGFTEKGAGGLSQKIESRDTNSLVSGLGLRVSPIIQRENGLLVPEASLAWVHDFDIDDRVIDSSFAGQPGTAFSIEGEDKDENAVAIGIGITFLGSSGFKPSLKYNGEFRDGYAAHGIIGELRWEF